MESKTEQFTQRYTGEEDSNDYSVESAERAATTGIGKTTREAMEFRFQERGENVHSLDIENKDSKDRLNGIARDLVREITDPGQPGPDLNQAQANARNKLIGTMQDNYADFMVDEIAIKPAYLRDGGKRDFQYGEYTQDIALTAGILDAGSTFADRSPDETEELHARMGTDFLKEAMDHNEPVMNGDVQIALNDLQFKFIVIDSMMTHDRDPNEIATLPHIRAMVSTFEEACQDGMDQYIDSRDESENAGAYGRGPLTGEAREKIGEILEVLETMPALEVWMIEEAKDILRSGALDD